VARGVSWRHEPRLKKADKNVYEKGIKIDDETLQNINLINKEFRGDWNYKISP